MMVHIVLPMANKVPISEAKAQLTELVRRAEAGEEVVLTRHGRPVVRLAPIGPAVTAAARKTVLEAARKSAAAKHSPGPGAARSQDFLYGDDGLPG